MNPKLGDVAFKVDGMAYTLNMGVNAMCCVEAETARMAAARDPQVVAAMARTMAAALLEEAAKAEDPKIRVRQEEIVQTALTRAITEFTMGEPALDVVARVVTAGRYSDTRLLLWGGLQRHHPEIDLDAAGDLVQRMNLAKGGRKAFEYILESLQLCSPQASDAEEANDTLDPTPSGGDGTGTASS